MFEIKILILKSKFDFDLSIILSTTNNTHNKQHTTNNTHSAMDALQTVVEIVFDIKVKLSDQEYLSLMDTLQKVHNEIRDDKIFTQQLVILCAQLNKEKRELKEEIDELKYEIDNDGWQANPRRTSSDIDSDIECDGV